MTQATIEVLSPYVTVRLLDSTAMACSTTDGFYVTGDYAMGEDYAQSPWETGCFPYLDNAWSAALTHLTDRNT